MTIGDLVVTVGAKIDGFKSAMGEVSSTAASATGKVTSSVTAMSSSVSAAVAQVGSKLTSLGTTMTAAVTLPLVGVGVAAVKTAGELEQSSVAFKTLMGSADAAAKHLADLRNFAASTPFEFTELVTASKRMQALGFSSKEVLPVLKVVGDTAAGLGMGAEGIQRIVKALGDMKSKGTVQADEMRQLAEAGIPGWQILAKTLNTDVAGAMKLVEKRAVDASVAVPALLAGMNEKFGGLMEQQSKTLLGQWSNLKDQITFTLTDIGTALMPIAKRMLENVFIPALGALKDLATGFSHLPGPVQTAMLGFGTFLGVVGPAAFVIGKLITAIRDLGTVYTATSLLMTTRVIPALFGTQAAASAVQLGTVAMGGTFVSTGSTISTTMATASASVMSLYTALGLITAALSAIYLGYVAWRNIQNDIKPLDPNRQEGALGENYTFTGFGAVPKYQPNKGAATTTAVEVPEAASYPRGYSESRTAHRMFSPGPVTLKKSAEDAAKEIKEAFADLGIKNLADDLREAEAAFAKLKAAGKLNEAWQIDQATKHLADLRGQIAEIAAGWKELPKPTEDLLKTLGVSAPENLGKVREMGSALSELSARIQAFVGPQQNGIMDHKLAEAWQNYAHAVATADDELKKHIDTVPWLQFATAVDKVDTSFTDHFSHVSLYYKTEADLNQELRESNNILRELPEAHRPVVDVIMDAFGSVKALTDAYHYFNVKTPAELQTHASESKRQYEIIKKAAGDAAVSTQIAWHKAMLDQIEMDHELGITDQELYEQRKKMAEDALKHLQGEWHKNSEGIKKDRYDLGRELEQMSHRTFDALERDLAQDLVQWKGWKDTIKDIGQTLATDFVQIMLKGLFKPLEDAFAGLAKKAGDALSNIFGGGGGSPIANLPTNKPNIPGVTTPDFSGVPGATPNAGGAASAAGSFSNIFSLATGAISAISGVFSAIGTFRLEGTMNAVEHNTRYLQIQFEKFAQQDEWDRETHMMLKLDDLWNEIRNVVAAVRETWTGVGMPEMAAAAPGNITIYVQGGDPAETARQVVSHLKRNGVYL